jgi:3-hydroxyisobutyrate dehydrogenase-like beta-hydroxyacid dehydrogenase
MADGAAGMFGRMVDRPVDRMVIGLIHPGEMGAAIGGQLRAAGHDVLWASAGRSRASAERAAAAGLLDAGSVGELTRRSDVILSVCPPHAATEVAAAVAAAMADAVAAAMADAVADAMAAIAGTVAADADADAKANANADADADANADADADADATRYADYGASAGSPMDARRIFVDANAISPTTTREIARVIRASGAEFVDGGIVGPPPASGGTRLYLSGPRSSVVRELFGGTAVDARIIEGAESTGGAGGTEGAEGTPGAEGAASAVKMAYAAWTKGTAALVLGIRALARAEGVEHVLLDEWAASQPELAGRSRGAARSALTKGWRWVAEMEEISASFAAAGLPGGFHHAAAEIFRRSPRITAATADEIAVDEIMAALLGDAGGPASGDMP